MTVSGLLNMPSLSDPPGAGWRRGRRCRGTTRRALLLQRGGGGHPGLAAGAQEHMYVLLGVGERRALRYDDFAAYYRRVRARFEAAIAAPAKTEPYPVEHCALCPFRGVCAARSQAEDNLALVANIRRDQVVRLREGGYPRSARWPDPPPAPRSPVWLAIRLRPCGTKRRCSSIDGLPGRTSLPAPAGAAANGGAAWPSR
jgi:hypothetical protein